ncbi:hypothetical protein Q7C_1444 [Methylophaga frappieri]|uniref:Uncharacterized protein n=1 Tax=Methylophaga frappieri (strain ATCC BAA-2434 / DSM 25690 / JAM7) TaxID=754477 RepID=I1YI50_METFJ|nr:hypothetical protein [Methylophaga frappieri]AFJ02593.1 hypothetical protein Q7C_1444 [Methylophaga frappieri]
MNLKKCDALRIIKKTVYDEIFVTQLDSREVCPFCLNGLLPEAT